MGQEVCNTAFNNLGSNDCAQQFGEPKRFMYTSLNKEDGTKNFITLADATAAANWQLKIDIYNFSSNPLEKVVTTPLIYEYANEQGDVKAFDQGGYWKALADGDYTMSYKWDEVLPDVIASMKSNEAKKTGIYIIDENDKIIGIGDGTNLYPIPLQNMYTQNFNMPTIDTISQETTTMRLLTPKDMNTLVSVSLADGEALDETYIYSLNDASNTISAPAVTGCQAVIATTRYSTAVVGATYDMFNFYDTAAPTVAIPLAAAGSLVELPNGTYTINEALLLTSGQTYLLKISYPRYDIAVGTVVVP